MKLEPIDYITMSKDIADLAEKYQRQKMAHERSAASTDKILGAHKEYWLTLAGRCDEMSSVIAALISQITERGNG